MRRAKVQKELKEIINQTSNNTNNSSQIQESNLQDLDTFEHITSSNNLISINDIDHIGTKIAKQYAHGKHEFIVCNIQDLEQKLYNINKNHASFIVCNLGKEHWVSIVVLNMEPKPILLYKDTLGTIVPNIFSEVLQNKFEVKINNIPETSNINNTAILALHVLEVEIINLNSEKSSSFIDDFSNHKMSTLKKTSDIKNGWLNYFATVKNSIVEKFASDLVKLSKDIEFKKALNELINNIPIEHVKDFDEYRKTLEEELAKPDEEIDINKISSARAKSFDSKLIQDLNKKFKMVNNDYKNITQNNTKLEIEQKFPEQVQKITKIFEALAKNRIGEKLDKSIKEISDRLDLEPAKLKVFFEYTQKEQAILDNQNATKEILDSRLSEVISQLPKITKPLIDHNDKPLEQLLSEIVLPETIIDDDDSSKLDPKEVIKRDFYRVREHYTKKWHDKNANDIYSWATNIKDKLAIQDIYETIAIMDRANELVTGGHRLRDTQILSVLTFLSDMSKGSICQINTGEGKTTIVSLLAVIKCLKGEVVDVISSNPVLADEGVRDKKDFYGLFGLRVATNNLDANYKEGVRDCYKKDIVYGTIGNFQFDYLKDSFLGLETRGARQFQTIILDEVDSMIIDNASHIAKLSSPFPGMESLKYVYIKIWQALHNAEENIVKNFQEKLKSKAEELYQKKLSETESQAEFEVYKTELTNQIIPSLKQAIKDTKPADIKFIPSHIKQYAESSIERWIDSAITAKFNYTEDEQYQVKEKDGELVIQPMDYTNTGVTLKNTVWQHGLHQFLQLKHNLQLTAESLTSCFISNLGYINKYNHSNIFGLTGTLGSKAEQELISQTYKVNCAEIPPYKPKQTQELNHWVVDDENFLEFVALNADEKVTEGRSVLIICETIKELKRLKEFLKQNSDAVIKTYSDEDSAHIVEDRVEAREIIIATNIAGRGTDFKTTQELEENGGLHVSVTFLPCNERVEDQAFGRTGRQGNDGTVQLIVKKSEIVKLGVEVDNVQTCDFGKIKEVRDIKEQERIKYIKENKIDELKFNDELFSHFSQLHKTLYLKNKSQPEFKYVLDDLKEFWAFWLEKTYFGNTNLKILDPAQEFQSFKREILDILQYSGISDGYVDKIISELGNYESKSSINIIKHNPYYSIKQAEYFLNKARINDAETALNHATSISENPEILHSAYMKLFEVAIEKGGQLQSRFIKALDDASFNLSSYFIKEYHKDQSYKNKAKKYLEKAKQAVKSEQDFLKTVIDINNKDFANIITPQAKIIDKAAHGYWYNDSDMNLVGVQLLSKVNLSTQFKNRLTFDLIKTFCKDQVLEDKIPIFICYNVGGKTLSDGGAHWLAMCVIKTQGCVKLLYKDSKGDFASHAQIVKAEFAKYYSNLDFIIHEKIEQKDSASCGVMTLKNLQVMYNAIADSSLEDFIQNFTKIKFCEQNEALSLKEELANVLLIDNKDTPSDNILLKHLASKAHSLEMYVLQIDSLMEQIDQHGKSIAIGSRVPDYFTNLKPATQSESVIHNGLSRSALTDLAMLGANTTYALKEIHDVHNEIVDGAQLQILAGIEVLAVGAVVVPAAPVILSMASTLISEGITDIAIEIVNQGNQEYSRANHVKGKIISYGIQLLTFGINALLECPAILNKASEACKGLSESLRKCPYFKNLCNNLANHMDEYASWFDDIAKYMSKTDAEKLIYLSVSNADELKKLGHFAGDINKFTELSNKGMLSGAFEFSWKLAANSTFDAIYKSGVNILTQQVTNQIMARVVNLGFEAVFLDIIKKAVNDTIRKNIDEQKLKTNDANYIINLISEAIKLEEPSEVATILKSSVLNVMRSSGNWKAHLVGFGLDMSAEYKELLWDYAFKRTKDICEKINKKLISSAVTKNSKEQVDSIIANLALQISQERCNKITSLVVLKTYNSIDSIKRIYTDLTYTYRMIEDIKRKDKLAGDLELNTLSDLYPNIDEFQYDYYPPSTEHPDGHYVPKGKDKHWVLPEDLGGGKKNNCLYDVIGFYTGEDPSKIRQAVSEQIATNPTKYLEPYRYIAENPYYTHVMVEGGCSNCHDITVSDEQYELALPDGKMFLVQKTWYKSIKDTTSGVKKIGYAVTQTGQVIILINPVIGAKVAAVGQFIVLSASAVSSINELYKSGSDSGVITEAFGKQLLQELGNNINNIAFACNKLGYKDAQKILSKVHTAVNGNDFEKLIDCNQDLEKLKRYLEGQSDKSSKEQLSKINAIISNIKTLSKGKVPILSDIVSGFKEFIDNANIEELEKSVNNGMITKENLNKKGEYNVINVLTTQELFRQNEQKAKEYYGNEWNKLNNNEKAVALAYITKNQHFPTHAELANYDKNLFAGNMIDNMLASSGDPTSIFYPQSEVVYNNILVNQYIKILSTNDKSKHLAFCKKEKELLISNNVSEQDIEICYDDTNCILMGSKIVLESDIAGISSYFGKYTIDAIKEILSLRIKDLALSNKLNSDNIEIFTSIFLNKEQNNLAEITHQVLRTDKKIVLVPLNLYNKHAVGLVFEKSNDGELLTVTYIDPSNDSLPSAVKKLIVCNSTISINFIEIEVEQQRYANCGPEVIEDFILYLTRQRVAQENAIQIHSKLFENSLSYNHNQADLSNDKSDESLCYIDQDIIGNHASYEW